MNGGTATIKLDVESRIVKGKFGWCGNMKSRSQFHRIRNFDSPATAPLDILYLRFFPVFIYPYTVHQTPDGSGYDYQHTSGFQRQMYFPITFDANTDFAGDPRLLDRSKPFYLFSSDKKYRSDAIDLSVENYRVGDQQDCALCLESLGLENQQEVLSCGHTFHGACMLKYTKPMEEFCFICAKFQPFPGERVELPQEHYFSLTCPVCRQSVW